MTVDGSAVGLAEVVAADVRKRADVAVVRVSRDLRYDPGPCLLAVVLVSAVVVTLWIMVRIACPRCGTCPQVQ